MAAKLTELCVSPEAMARVGEAAARELYISWEDAVKHACERYELVIDAYRAGRYQRRSTRRDEHMKYQGELMEALGQAAARRQEVRNERLEKRREVKEKLQTGEKKLKENLEKRYMEFWEHMERYL